MPRDEMVARMSSPELTAWYALFEVQSEEREINKLRQTSRDGEVIISGRDEDTDDDGEAE